MLRRVLVVAGLALAAGAALAAGEGHDGGHERMVKHRLHGGSVEHVAMHNIMAELISTKTGKSLGEVQAAFEGAHPHEAIEKLGLSEDDLQPLHKEARQKLIAKAQAAGLITAAQAEKIRSQPHPRMKHRPLPPPPPDLDE